MFSSLYKKISLLSGQNFWETKEQPEIKIKKMAFSDGPSGIRKQKENQSNENKSVKETNFPCPTVIASTFNKRAAEKEGALLAQVAKKNSVDILLAPAVNIKKNNKNGRNFEYLSEDPLLTAEIAKKIVSGIQKEKIAACPKHYLANNQEKNRYTINEKIGSKALKEIYLYPFRDVVLNAKPWTLMASYNKINSEHVIESKKIIKKQLRGKWRYTGLVVSDWGAIKNRIKSLRATVDLEMPGPASSNQRKIISRVGLFHVQPHKIEETYIRYKLLQKRLGSTLEHKEKETLLQRKKRLEKNHLEAIALAEEGAVLLKNDRKIFPLAKNEKVLVVGEFAEKPKTQGGGSSYINSYKVDSFLDSAEKDVDYIKGFSTSKNKKKPTEKEIDFLIKKAEKYDKVVVFAGLYEEDETEGVDRKTLKLPEEQNTIISALAAKNKKVGVVLHNGGPVEMPWVNAVQGILEMYLAGEGAGKATYNLLYNKKNPSGKLAETFPLKEQYCPDYLFYPPEQKTLEYNEGIFVGYRYYDKKDLPVLFPFGHGLSYTTFEYKNIKVEKLDRNYNYKVTATIKNIGNVAGAEAAQLYTSYQGDEKYNRPLRELKGFDKVFLEPGEEKGVEFILQKKHFSIYDERLKKWLVPEGQFEIQIGASSRDIRLSEKIYLETSFKKVKWVGQNTEVKDLLDVELLKKIINPIIQREVEKNQLSSKNALNKEMLEATIKEGPIRLARNFHQVPELALKAGMVLLNIATAIQKSINLYKRSKQR